MNRMEQPGSNPIKTPDQIPNPVTAPPVPAPQEPAKPKREKVPA